MMIQKEEARLLGSVGNTQGELPGLMSRGEGSLVKHVDGRDGYCLSAAVM